MFKRLACAVAGVLASAGVAYAGADQPLYGPAPAWVQPVPITTDVKPTGAAADVLLHTVQNRLGSEGTESFVDTVVRINAPEGI